MKNIMLLGVAIMAAASFVLSDTVFTKDGKTYEGKVTKASGKVIVETKDGRIEVREDNILLISRPEDLVPLTPASTSAPSPVVSPTPAPAIGVSRFFSSVLPKGIEQPESAVFLMMRKIQASVNEPMPADAAVEFDGWRAAAHDRRRRFGTDWVSADTFVRMKKTHSTAVADAAACFKQIKKTTTATNPTQIKTLEDENKKYKAQGVARLRQAAEAWPDKTLRAFLIGDVEMLNGNYTMAERYFFQCRTDCPLVAAFWQGQALAALELTERQLDAVTYFIEAVKLCPSSAELFKQLNDAMGKVPGTRLSSPAYLAAQDFILKFKQPSGGSTGAGGTSTIRMKYALPGKEASVKENELVALPFDRLYVQQAVGIPVNAGELLVDAAVLKDALAVYVRIDPKTVVAVDGKTSGPTIRKIGNELAAVKITTHLLVPTKHGKDDKLKAGDEVWVYTADLYSEMGDGKVRLAKGAVTQVSADGVNEVNVKLQPGECSAPVVHPDGRLAGVLVGKTFPEQNGGGPDKFISLAKLTNIAGAKSPPKTAPPPATMSTAYVEPLQLVPGQGFMLYIIKGETFKE